MHKGGHAICGAQPLLQKAGPGVGRRPYKRGHCSIQCIELFKYIDTLLFPDPCSAELLLHLYKCVGKNLHDLGCIWPNNRPALLFLCCRNSRFDVPRLAVLVKILLSQLITEEQKILRFKNRYLWTTKGTPPICTSNHITHTYLRGNIRTSVCRTNVH